MIKVNAIKLPDAFDIYKNTDGEKAEFLESVSKINIFVGSNNSGKSRFMRELSMQNSYEAKIQGVNLETSNIIISNSLERIKRALKAAYFEEVDGLRITDLDDLISFLPITLNLSKDSYQQIRKNSNSWVKFSKISSWTGHGHPNNSPHLEGLIREESQIILDTLVKTPSYSESDNPKKVYIPTLRGLRQLDRDHTDYYREKTRNDYFSHQVTISRKDEATNEELSGNPEVFTGLTLYQRITDLLLGNNSERKLISNYQEFISKKLFEGKSVALIPNQKEKVVIVKIGSEKEQPIHHLGDGIQSAIILTFLPFVMQEQTFFFIEEPEIYLHPGLQRKILNFYDSLKQHTFFLTTHSNHFLDITIDIKDVSIFTFRKIFDESDEEELTPNFTIEAVDSGCESSLELLGVRNSSVFLVNATIWVEGITDRWYLREMLNSYMKYLKDKGELKLNLEEDTHYSFVEYGGANITHWSFLDKEEHPIAVERLCAKAFVIIDKDGDKKETRKEELEEKLGKRLVILPCREVENLLPYSVIKQVVEEYEKNPDLKLKEYNYSQYQDIYLGRFIEDIMLKKNPSREGGYKADSGTLKQKVKFCEKALNKIQYSELPDSTKEIIQNIYQFIYEKNS